MMKFVGYANLTFDDADTKHLFPIINMQEKFNRVKTNCLVYDLYDTAFNPKIYDKMILYHEIYGKVGYFNYFMWNSETGEKCHITWIEDAFDNLIQRINKSFNTIRRRKMFEYYGQQYDATKAMLKRDEFGNLSIAERKVEIPTVKDMEKMYEYYETIDLIYADKLKNDEEFFKDVV